MSQPVLLHRPEPDDPKVGLCGSGGYTAVKAVVKAGVVTLEPREWVICGRCEEVARQFGFTAAPIFDADAAALLARSKAQEPPEESP